jgi:hypothetical protein
MPSIQHPFPFESGACKRVRTGPLMAPFRAPGRGDQARASGATFREVAVTSGSRRGRMYGRFKNAGVGRTPAEWRADVTR